MALSHISQSTIVGVMHKCPHKPEACKFRHYYVSSEEKLRGVESRRAAGMRREMNVLKAITHREGLLAQIRKEVRFARVLTITSGALSSMCDWQV